jgi:hypothetical protein
MATGTGLGALIPVAMTLVGIVTMLRARAKRRNGPVQVDEDFERRRAATAEAERRMASYLAGRQTDNLRMAPDEVPSRENVQESRQ